MGLSKSYRDARKELGFGDPMPQPEEQVMSFVPVARPRSGRATASGGYKVLSALAQNHGFDVTSTTGGRHNTGSLHGRGLAIDVRTRNKTPQEIAAFMATAQSAGYRVLDERTRPRGQRVWGGPHLHLETRATGGTMPSRSYAAVRAEYGFDMPQMNQTTITPGVTSGSSGGTRTSADRTSRPSGRSVGNSESIAMDFFLNKGYTRAQAAGIVGNLIGESNLNPTIRGDNGKAYGIGQWHPDRQAGLRAFARRNGGNSADLVTQLGYVDHELRTSERRAGDAIRSSRDVYGATHAMTGFERPQGWSRGGRAENVHGWQGRFGHASRLATPTRETGGYLPKMAEGGAVDGDIGTMEDPTPLGRRIFARLLGAGYTREQASGIIGNMIVESGGLNTSDVQERGPISGRGGLGMIQWTGPRRVALEAYGAERGIDPRDEVLQGDFMMHELATTHRNVDQRIRSAQTAEEAAWIFAEGYERPQGSSEARRTGDRSRLSHMDRREAAATDSLTDYADINAPRSTGPPMRAVSSPARRRAAPVRRPTFAVPPRTPMPGGRRDATATPRFSPRGMGGSVGGAAGSIAGQALIPIPGVGAMIGGTVGEVAGGLVEKGFKSNNLFARGAAGFAVGGPAGLAASLIFGGHEEKPQVAQMRGSRGYMRKGGHLPKRFMGGPTDPPVRYTAAQIAERVAASVDAERAAYGGVARTPSTVLRRGTNSNLFASRRAEEQRVLDSRRTVSTDGGQTVDPTLARYRSLTTVNGRKQGGAIPRPGARGGNTYIAKQFDTLGDIARENGVSFREMLRLNPNLADLNNMKEGYVVRLPENAASRTTTPPPAADPASTTLPEGVSQRQVETSNPDAPAYQPVALGRGAETPPPVEAAPTTRTAPTPRREAPARRTAPTPRRAAPATTPTARTTPTTRATTPARRAAPAPRDTVREQILTASRDNSNSPETRAFLQGMTGTLPATPAKRPVPPAARPSAPATRNATPEQQAEFYRRLRPGANPTPPRGTASSRRGMLSNPGQPTDAISRLRALPEARRSGRIFAEGGHLPIGQDAVKFRGPKHEQGGIPMPERGVEVEGGETMDKVSGQDYVFSQSVKVPGSKMTFAQAHEKLVKSDAPQEAIERLAALQEKVTGRAGGQEEMNPDAQQPMQQGQPVDPSQMMEAPQMRVGGPLPRVDLTGVARRFNQGAGAVGDAAKAVFGAATSAPVKDAASKYGAEIFNIGSSFLSRDKTPAAARVNTSSFAGPVQDMSIRPLQAEIMAAGRPVMNGSGSNNVKLAAHAETLKGLGQLNQQAIQSRQQAFDSRTDKLAQAASQNAQYDETYRQDKMGSDAAREAQRNAGFAGIRTRQDMETLNKNTDNSNMTAMAASMANMTDVVAERYIAYVAANNPALAEQLRTMRAQANTSLGGPNATPGITAPAATPLLERLANPWANSGFSPPIR